MVLALFVKMKSALIMWRPDPVNVQLILCRVLASLSTSLPCFLFKVRCGFARSLLIAVFIFFYFNEKGLEGILAFRCRAVEQIELVRSQPNIVASVCVSKRDEPENLKESSLAEDALLKNPRAQTT